MDPCLKTTLTSISCTLALLASVALAPAAMAQGQDPATAAAAAAKNAQEAKQREEQQSRDREAERLRDDELMRANSERKRQLREALQKDQAVLDQPRQLLTRLFQLPDTLQLSAENRLMAGAMLQAHRERAAAAWPAWQEQAIARVTAASGKRAPEAEHVALQLAVRTLNESALWFADAEPHASDSLWIEALRRDGLCRGLAAAEPAARIAALIEALPPERRAAAWAGEAARLSRWGQEARTLLPPPERALEDALVPALAPAALAKTLGSMPAALRAALQAPGWNLATQAPAQRCELLRWWSQEQVRLKQLSPRQAMLAWRTALAPRSADFLLAGQPRSGADALDKSGFPQVARSLALTGRVFVEQDIDAAGKVLHAFVQRRELSAASLGNQAPLTLEHELDRATLDRVAAMPTKAPDPATLRDGLATRRVGIEWVLN